MLKPIRVRFAPSPTGELHLGGARTAIFNWLFARQKNGYFYLRIEDTDAMRSRQEYVEQICDSIRWLGLNWDEPMVFQSLRKDQHCKAVKKMLSDGNAYRCFCTVDDLAKEREKSIKESGQYKYSQRCRHLSQEEIKVKLNGAEPFCVRIKVREGETAFTDIIYGEIKVDNKEIDDFIIQRTDGTPTYNLTVVVDDSDMEISHVIRGEDHLSNTPKQILIYNALEKTTPKFAHLPMILGPDKKRLSKRHGATGVQEFCNQGLLPQTLINYLAMLGWNPDTEQEIFTVEQLKDAFQIEQVQKKAAVYDEKKLYWLSGQQIAQESTEELLDRIRELDSDWRLDAEREYLLQIIDIQKKRVKTLTEIMTLSDFFFEDPSEYDSKTARKRWKDKSVNSLVQSYVDKLSQLDEWSENILESKLREVTEEKEISMGKLIHPVRLAITGVPHGPSLFLTMEVLGQEICLRRLKTALEKLPKSIDQNEEVTVSV